MDPKESAAPQPAPATAPAPEAAKSVPSGYISNPVALFMPSWNAVKLNLGAYISSILIPAGIILLATIVLVVWTIAHPLGLGVSVAVDVLAGLAVFVALAYLFAPVVTMLMIAGARGKKVSFSEVYKQGAPYRGKMVILAILTGLAILGGLILFIVPGIIFATWFALGSYAVIDENLDAVDAMKRSKELVQGHFVEMLAMLGFSSALGILGIIPILGSLVALVLGLMYSGASAIRFDQLKALKASNQPAPPVHWANYAVIVLAIAGTVIGNKNGFKSKNLNTNDVNMPVMDNMQNQ